MGSESKPAKLLLPFLQRADELQNHEPLVAYYCPEDNLYVEGFASNMFSKADKQGRVGRADLNTAKTFYAASIFFEILTQFGDLQPDIELKLKYAVWKAADIRKAIKGRKPEPGPPGGEKDMSIPSSSPTSSYDLEPSQSFSASQQGAGTPRHTKKDPGPSESFTTGYSGANSSSQAVDIFSGSGSFTTNYQDADQSSQPSDMVNPYNPNPNCHPENSIPLPPYLYPSFQAFTRQPSPQSRIPGNLLNF